MSEVPLCRLGFRGVAWRWIDPAAEWEARIDGVDVPAVEENRRVEDLFELVTERVGHCGVCVDLCRGTLLIRNCLLLGPFRRFMSRVLRWSYGGGSFL